MKICVLSSIEDSMQKDSGACENLSEFAKAFPKEGFVASRYLWGMQFWLLNAYHRVVGDIIPPILGET